MTRTELHDLAARLEGSEQLDPDSAARIGRLVAAAFPGRLTREGTGAETFLSADTALAFVADALQSWSVHITGHSAVTRGRWTCTIRETGVRDDDELIGVGKAGTLANAVSAALLKIIELRGPLR